VVDRPGQRPRPGRFWLGESDGRDVVVIAHRFAWAPEFGVEDLQSVPVLGHRCDNPLCQRTGTAPDGSGHVQRSSPRERPGVGVAPARLRHPPARQPRVPGGPARSGTCCAAAPPAPTLPRPWARGCCSTRRSCRCGTTSRRMPADLPSPRAPTSCSTWISSAPRGEVRRARGGGHQVLLPGAAAIAGLVLGPVLARVAARLAAGGAGPRSGAPYRQLVEAGILAGPVPTAVPARGPSPAHSPLSPWPRRRGCQC